MDPATAAGVALAVVGLSAQCFIGVIHAIQLIVEAKDLKKDYRYLTILLQLEQQRCFNWANSCGFLAYINADGELDAALEARLMRLDNNTILQSLIHIQSLLQGFIKIKGRYEALSAEDSPRKNFQQPHGRLAYCDYAADDPSQRTLPEIADFLNKSKNKILNSSLPKRLRWASFDKKNFETLIERLQQLSNALLDLAGYEIREEIRKNTLETRMAVLQMNQRMDDLSNLLRAFLSVNDVTAYNPHVFNPTGAVRRKFSEPELQKDMQLANLTQFKMLNTSFEGHSSLSEIEKDLDISSCRRNLDNIELTRGNLKISNSPRSDIGRFNKSDAIYRVPGTSSSQDVWIEWKYYDPSVRSRGPTAPTKGRAEELARLLKASQHSTSFRIPTFLGFFDDGLSASHAHASASSSANSLDETDSDLESEDAASDERYRFGFVFQKPPARNQTTPARVFSLWDLIKSERAPSLTRRVELARKIAHSLRFLHSVDWLHKGLRSHDILFFADDMSRVDPCEPSLAGFDFARPARKGAQTETPCGPLEYNYYRHPQARGAAQDPQDGQGFRRTFDIYSLGVVMVEIACWRSIDDLLNITKPRVSATTNIRSRLLHEDQYMAAVEAGAGSLFRGAAEVCLAGPAALGIHYDDDETDIAISIKVSRSFSERVLRVLDNIKI